MKTLTIASEGYAVHQSLDSNPRLHIEQSTLEYLHTAFLLYEYKQTRSKRQYRRLLEEFGWDKGSLEQRRSLQIAENFQAFVNHPEDLAVLPIWVLQKLCSKNYKILISELTNIPIGGLTCEFVLELIQSRKAFLKSQNQEKKEGNWRATPDGSRYYSFGKIMEVDHQTGVLTDKLEELLQVSAQQIVRIAIANFYDKILAETATDEGNATVSESQESNVSEDLRKDSTDSTNSPNWESKQQEFESLLNTDTEWHRHTDTEWHRHTESNRYTESNRDREWDREEEKEEEDTCSEYLEEPEESDFNFEEDELEVLEKTQLENVEQENTQLENTEGEILATNQTPFTDAEILAEILRKASDYSDMRRGLYEYQAVKGEAWKLLSSLEKQSVNQILPEEIKQLSNAKREGLIINFYEVESGGIYKIFTVDNPLIEETVTNIYLHRWLAELRVRLCCHLK